MSLPLRERIVYLIRLPLAFVRFFYEDLYAYFCGKTPDPKQSLEGKTVLITGANRGIGRQVARDLYERKAKLVIACRSKQAAEEAFKEYLPSSRIVIHDVDLTSLMSVRELAQKVLKSELRLDVLIHNAGILGPKEKTITRDNIESTFQVNYVAPFLLTQLLLPLLKQTNDSRVVCVTSEFNLLPYYFDKDLVMPSSPKYDALLNYSHSKLALCSFVVKMAESLSESGVVINAVHPGCVKTNFVNENSARFYRISFFFQKLIRGVSVERGARGAIYLAISPQVHSINGQYFVGGNIAQPNKLCRKKEIREEIWRFTEELVLRASA